MDLDAEIDRLYELDADEFVAGRDELVKRLRAEKRREDATAVKALRRPTVVAWALNQLARREREGIDELLAAGDALREAQRQALGGDASALRTAGAERRKVVDRLRKRAAAVLEAAGKGSDATLDQVAAGLEAASADPAAGEELRQGRLSKELEGPSGFGGLSLDDALAASVTAGRDDRRKGEALAKAAAEAEERAEEARRHVAEAAAEVERLERELAEARVAAADAEQALEEAERAAADAAAAAADAD